MTFKFNDDWEKVFTALETGKYPQGIKYLCKEGKFCCLGVMCQELLGEPDSVDEDRIAHWGSDWEILPENLVKRLGLRSPSGAADHKSEGKTTLAHMNDSGSTHQEIAAFIRANPEKLLKQEFYNAGLSS